MARRRQCCDRTRSSMAPRCPPTARGWSTHGSKRIQPELHGSGIYVIDTDWGRPRLLKKAGRRQWYAGSGWVRTLLTSPEFSPDGTQIAYADGMGDWGNGLRVMNADGSYVRVLIENDQKLLGEDIVHPLLTWSPDGSQLAFSSAGGICVIGPDGSGLRKLIRGGLRPNWSPDGSRIAYQVEAPDWSGTASDRGRKRW